MEIITQESIDQVKQYHHIVEIISRYITLKKRGKNYIGLCPFHNEKTPSFTVSPEKNMYYCFGCNASGDHIKFVREVDSLNFTEAIELIGQIAGITIEKQQVSSEKQSKVDEIRKILTVTNQFFHEQIFKHEGPRNYLLQRSLVEESIQKFQLGYCPSSQDLIEYLRPHSFSESALRESGLFFENSNQLECRFNHRVIFPIIDYLNRVVGFSCRTLSNDKKVPKYVNSSETVLFNKRKLLYGLLYAKTAIKSENKVLLMEGFMDVIMSHQAGIEYVVATMGTALTKEHVQKITRFTSNIFLCLDNDEAGQQAMERSYEMLRTEDCKVFTVPFDQKDPADFIVQNGNGRFQDVIQNNAQPSILFYFERVLKKYEPIQVEDKSKIITELLPFLIKEKDQIVLRHYVKQLANSLKIEEEFIMAKISNSMYNEHNQFQNIKIKHTNKYEKAEQFIIAVMASSQKYKAYVLEKGVSETDFRAENHQELFKLIINNSNVNHDLVNEISDEALKKKLCEYILKGEEKGRSTVKALMITFN